MRVGFIGVGNMGRPMARNLLKAGFDLVVRDIVESPVKELAAAGATPAASPAEVARESEMVVTALPTVEAVEQVYLADNGLIPAARTGQVLADHSTVKIGTSRRLAQEATARGVPFLDAPISGGVERAIDGTLSIMVGGDPAAFEKARPVFEAMGSNVQLMGPSGSGTVTKLVNQYLVSVHMTAVCEALVMAVKAGVEPRRLLELLLTAWGASTQLERAGPLILARDFTGGATNYILSKDIECVRDLAQEVGAPARLLDVARQLMDRTLELGLREADITSMVVPLEKEAGTEVRG